MIGGNDKPDITTDIPKQPDPNPDEGGDGGDSSDDGTDGDDQSTDGDDQSDGSGDDDTTGDDGQNDDETGDDDEGSGDDEEGPDDEENPDEEESAPYRHRHRNGNCERNGAPNEPNFNCMKDEEQKEAVKIMEPNAKCDDEDKGEKHGQDDVTPDPEPADEEPVMDADVGEEPNQEQKSDGPTNGNSQKNNP